MPLKSAFSLAAAQDLFGIHGIITKPVVDSRLEDMANPSHKLDDADKKILEYIVKDGGVE